MSAVNKNVLTIRYIGPDDAHEYVVQRGDKMFWSGFNWVKTIDSAKVFTDHKAAQATVAALMHQRHKGKPSRKFKLNVTVTLTDENVQNIPASSLAAWLHAALRLDIENLIYGDGPTADSYVKARIEMSSFQETPE
jgi:hypothetical protein